MAAFNPQQTRGRVRLYETFGDDGYAAWERYFAGLTALHSNAYYRQGERATAIPASRQGQPNGAVATMVAKNSARHTANWERAVVEEYNTRAVNTMIERVTFLGEDVETVRPLVQAWQWAPFAAIPAAAIAVIEADWEDEDDE